MGFRQCYELKPAFDLLLQRPLCLQLVTNESYPTNRRCSEQLILADYDNPNTNNPSKKEYFEIEGLSHFMHVVSRMSSAVRVHFREEYKQKLVDYKRNAAIALKEKRRIDREEKKKQEAIAMIVDEENKELEKEFRQRKRSDKEEMDVSDDEVNGLGLNSKAQFDLAARTALSRSNQMMNDEQEH